MKGIKWRPMKLALSSLAVLALILLAQPAQACGCGGYISQDGNAYVSQEQTLLRWDGQTEQLVMSLGVLGSSKDAAVVLPVPARATVELGDAKLWDELSNLTKPLVVHEKQYVSPFFFGAGAAAPEGAGSAPVTVLDRQTLGPFEVTNLAATDSSALADWLTANGYQLSPGLAEAFQPYVAEGWFYVAVKLRPGAGDSLSGALDPLKVTFSSSQLVYPMRGSEHAQASESVTVYVLADHRVQKDQDFGSSHVAFADWVDPTTLPGGSRLAPFVDHRLFLTKFEEQVVPAQVNDDYRFTFTAQDDLAHDTVTVYDDDYTLVYASWACLGLLLVLPFAAGLAAIGFWLRRRRAAT